MSTTVTISISDTRLGIFGGSQGTTETNIIVTRDTKAQAIAEAITMLAASHRPELERAWNELRAQVEPLLQAYRDTQTADTADIEPDAGGTAA